METPAQMRRNAQRCEIFARDKTLTDEERQSFIDAAEAWRMMADRHEQPQMERRRLAAAE